MCTTSITAAQDIAATVSPAPKAAGRAPREGRERRRGQRSDDARRRDRDPRVEDLDDHEGTRERRGAKEPDRAHAARTDALDHTRAPSTPTRPLSATRVRRSPWSIPALLRKGPVT
jgi:hypothetical protein